MFSDFLNFCLFGAILRLLGTYWAIFGAGVVVGCWWWFFGDYRVSPNFLLCWGWVVVEVGLGCDNSIVLLQILTGEVCQQIEFFCCYVLNVQVHQVLDPFLLYQWHSSIGKYPALPVLLH